MKKNISHKVLKNFSFIFTALYLISIFNFEILNAVHSFSHYITHTININHQHNLLNHLNEIKKSHDHSKILLSLANSENENEKDKAADLNEIKIDQHITSEDYSVRYYFNLIRFYNNISNKTLLLNPKPVPPPPKNFA